jgi:hypothetical protein
VSDRDVRRETVVGKSGARERTMACFSAVVSELPSDECGVEGGKRSGCVRSAKHGC